MHEGQGEVWLSRYHCLERLGTGPLGVTWRARVFGLGGFEKDFAITRLRPSLSTDEAFLVRFVAAANAAARLTAARIARVQEVESEGDHCYLVCDLARGLDLALLNDLVKARGGGWPREAALALVLDVGETLVYAHG